MKAKSYGSIDYFRMLAALLVVAIHTAPLATLNADLDFLFTYCLGRIAVPFFLVTTGFFVSQAPERIYRYLIKTGLYYLGATLLYLPLSWYAGNLPKDFGGALKMLFFDGTFYHLWYFPAMILGCVIVTLLLKKSMKAAFFYVVVAYLIGLFGDSYYGIIENNAVLKSIYEGLFTFSSYTRNGLFFTPIFLFLGVVIARAHSLYSKRSCIWGLSCSSLLLLLEGWLTYHFQLQRHNSMYLCLLPVIYFLFQLLLQWPTYAPVYIRKSAMLIFIIHPAVIVVVRAIAKKLELSDILVDNSMIHYLTVCVISLITAFVLQACIERGKALWSRRDVLGLN